MKKMWSRSSRTASNSFAFCVYSNKRSEIFSNFFFVALSFLLIHKNIFFTSYELAECGDENDFGDGGYVTSLQTLCARSVCAGSETHNRRKCSNVRASAVNRVSSRIGKKAYWNGNASSRGGGGGKKNLFNTFTFFVRFISDFLIAFSRRAASPTIFFFFSLPIKANVSQLKWHSQQMRGGRKGSWERKNVCEYNKLKFKLSSVTQCGAQQEEIGRST